MKTLYDNLRRRFNEQTKVADIKGWRDALHTVLLGLVRFGFGMSGQIG